MKKIIIAIVALLVLGLAGFWFWKPIQNITKVAVEDQTDFYSIKAEYPKDPWDKQGVMRQMVDYMVNLKKEEWRADGDLYKAEQKISKDFPDRPKMKYELNISYVATSSTKMKTRSYVFSVYEFTGGAHGNTAIVSLNFTKDEQIKIEDAIDFNQEDYLATYVSLANILKSKLVASLGENSNEATIADGLGLKYIKSDGTFDKEKCNCDGYYFPSNIQVFTIQDNGIKFIFGQYQVAAYVVGMPEVLVDWQEIKSYLNKDSYLSKNI